MVHDEHKKRDKVNTMVSKEEDPLDLYIKDCVSVTWLMNCCIPPMVISFGGEPGEKFNKKRHTRFGGKGEYVEFYMWPCLFISEEDFNKGSPAFGKGDVYVCKDIHSLKAPGSARRTSNSLTEEGNSGKNILNPKKPLPQIEQTCLLYTSPSPRDATLSRMPSSA